MKISIVNYKGKRNQNTPYVELTFLLKLTNCNYQELFES